MNNEELRRIFSNNLSYWLNYRGKTQADLYKMANVSSATASDWCNAKKIPRADKIVDIADWLGVELTDLLTEKQKNYDEFDALTYRIKDDEDFKNTVFDILYLNDDNYQKLKDYLSLLKK